MDMKWLTIAGVALVVLFIARQARASSDPSNPANWDYLPGAKPGAGYYA